MPESARTRTNWKLVEEKIVKLGKAITLKREEDRFDFIHAIPRRPRDAAFFKPMPTLLSESAFELVLSGGGKSLAHNYRRDAYSVYREYVRSFRKETNERLAKATETMQAGRWDIPKRVRYDVRANMVFIRLWVAGKLYAWRITDAERICQSAVVDMTNLNAAYALQ